MRKKFATRQEGGPAGSAETRKGADGRSGPIGNPHELLRLTHLGLQFAIAVGGMVGLGFLADQKLGLLPLFTMIGLLLGFTAGMYLLYKEVYGSGPGKEPR